MLFTCCSKNIILKSNIHEDINGSNPFSSTIKKVIEHDEERIRVGGSCLIGIPPKNKV